MSIVNNICPSCGSERSVSIDMSSSAEYASLIYINHGSARLMVCLDCGTVYIDQFDRELINKKLTENTRKRRNKC